MNDGHLHRIAPPWFLLLRTEDATSEAAASTPTGNPTYGFYERNDDGTATFVGRVSRRDAGELEQDVRREIAHRRKQQGPSAAQSGQGGGGPALSSRKKEEEEGPQGVSPRTEAEAIEASGLDDFVVHPEISVSAHEQNAFRESRARAKDVGEALGLSNVQIGEIRMAFEKFADDRKASDAPLREASFDDFLNELGFEDAVEHGRHRALWDQYHVDGAIDLEAALRIFYDLDAAGEGVQIY